MKPFHANQFDVIKNFGVVMRMDCIFYIPQCFLFQRETPSMNSIFVLSSLVTKPFLNEINSYAYCTQNCSECKRVTGKNLLLEEQIIPTDSRLPQRRKAKMEKDGVAPPTPLTHSKETQSVPIHLKNKLNRPWIVTTM